MTLLSIVPVVARFWPAMLRPFLFGLVVFVYGSRPAVALTQAQSESPARSKPTVLLAPSERREFQLDPNQRETFLLDPKARTHVEIVFEQTEEMLSVRRSSAGRTNQLPRTNDAGL